MFCRKLYQATAMEIFDAFEQGHTYYEKGNKSVRQVQSTTEILNLYEETLKNQHDPSVL